MMIVELTKGWTLESDVYVRGTAYIDNSQLSGASLADEFSEISSKNEFKNKLQKMNGFYQVIITNETILAATDHIASQQLYYGYIEDEPFITNSGSWIVNNFDKSRISEIAEVELISNRPGVIKNETRYQRVKRLRPGQILEINNKFNDDIFNTNYYYKPHINKSVEELQDNPTDIKSNLDEKLTNAFQRLVDYADGRQIVLPLSSGYDSTLNLLKISELNYDNVVCFTKKDWGNEVQAGKKIAGEIGYPWYSPSVSHSNWKEFYDSGGFDEFFEKYPILSSYISISYLIPIRNLLKRDIIEEDAILVPGHTAIDIHKRTPRSFVKNKKIKDEQIISKILDYHDFFLNRPGVKIRNDELKNVLEKRIYDSLNINSGKIHNRLAISHFEQFWWKVYASGYWRQPTYEYFNLNFWYPLLDKDIMEFWTNVHPYQKTNQTIYHSYINELYYNIVGKQRPEKNENTIESKIKQYITDTVLEKPAEVARDRLLPSKGGISYNYESNPKFGIIGEKTFDELNLGSRRAGLYIKLLALDKMDNRTQNMKAFPNDKYEYKFDLQDGIVIS